MREKTSKRDNKCLFIDIFLSFQVGCTENVILSKLYLLGKKLHYLSTTSYWFFLFLLPSYKSVFLKGLSMEEVEGCSWIYGHLIGPRLGWGPNPATKRGERIRVVKAPALFCAESTRTEGELFLIFFVIRQRLLSRGIRTEKWKKNPRGACHFIA